MPLTFIDIEKQKTWRIGVFFLILVLMYFVVCLAFAFPFIGHAKFVFSRYWPFGLLIACVIAGIHFLFTGYNAVDDVVVHLSAQEPDAKDDVHNVLLDIIQEINIATGSRKTIKCVVIPTLSLNALAAADLKGQAVIGITEGLLSRLTRPQLETVIAHEAHHIISGDCLESTVAASLFGSLISLLDKSSETPQGRNFPYPVLWPAWILLKLSYMLNMLISREREYRADAGAVQMTRNPVALAETLYLLSRGWRGAGFIGSGYEMLCIINPEATALDESETFWADLISTHPPIQKRIDVLLSMAHMNIAGLISKIQAEAPTTASSSAPAYYAMNPQQQWQGPFTIAELGALPWLSPLSWIRTGDTEAIDRAWKDPLINTIFMTRLNQDQTVTDYSCPACRQPLIMESYEGTQIDQCRFCAGILVENSKIPRILARTDPDRFCSERVKALAMTTIQENQRKFAEQKLMNLSRSAIPLLACPKCKNPMYRGFYSAAYLIEIDRCSFCGITWFDRDELAMLQCLIASKPSGGDSSDVPSNQ